MTLKQHQQEFLRVCSSSSLENGHRWSVYRDLVRGCLRAAIHEALPRSALALGAQFEVHFADWLEHAPPTTRYLREVAPGFADYVMSNLDTPYLRDLLLFERTRWELRYAYPGKPSTVDLSFDRIPSMNPASRLLKLSFSVHEAEPSCTPTRILVFRHPASHRVEWRLLNALAADLVERWQNATQTIAESVREITQAQGILVDMNFHEKLAEMISGFVQDGILFGSHFPTNPIPPSNV